MITILNSRHGVRQSDGPDIFLVDRRTSVGNPFILTDEIYRDEVCDKYEAWFYDIGIKDPQVQEYLSTLRRYLHDHGSIKLLCWCVPKRCHAETIKKWLEDNPL